MMRFISVLLFFLVLPVAGIGAEDKAAVSGDPAAGAQIAGKVCAVCHGTDGNSPLSANPNLAGQHPGYLLKQLMDFKSGRRSNAIMAGMVANLTEQDMRNLAAFYAGQSAKESAAKDMELASRGQELYRAGIAAKGIAACGACHGPDGAGIPPLYPRVSGQHSEYVVAQLRAFRAGNRDNDANKMMRMVSARLSEEEINALAEYISGLR